MLSKIYWYNSMQFHASTDTGLIQKDSCGAKDICIISPTFCSHFFEFQAHCKGFQKKRYHKPKKP